MAGKFLAEIRILDFLGTQKWTVIKDITPIDSYKVETIDTVTFENSHLANLRDLDQNSNVNIHNQQNPNSEIPQPNTPGKGWYFNHQKFWFIEHFDSPKIMINWKLWFIENFGLSKILIHRKLWFTENFDSTIISSSKMQNFVMKNLSKFRKNLEQSADWIILGSSGGGSLPGSEVKQEPTSQMDNKTHIECVVSFKIRFLW